MKTRGFALGLLCSAILFQPGCIFVSLTKEYVPQSISEMQPPDYRETVMEDSDGWTETAGKEGRGDRPREMVPDGWIDRLIKSPKARAIENNMGIDFE